jgi:ABC-type microcin C transport system permease subunit YejB
LLKRILLMIPTMIGIVVASFFVMKLAPGDPSALKFGGGAEQATAGINSERGTEGKSSTSMNRCTSSSAISSNVWSPPT